MEDNMFKKGDKVRCIDSTGLETGSFLTLGKVYTILGAGYYLNTVRILEDNEVGRIYDSSRFELVNESNTFEFQVGDIVEFGGLEGEVKKISDNLTRYPVNVVFKNESFRDDSWYFTLDGKLDERHIKPLLNLVSRPKKKEKRIVKTTVKYSPSLNEVVTGYYGLQAEDLIEVTLEKEIEVEV